MSSRDHYTTRYPIFRRVRRRVLATAQSSWRAGWQDLVAGLVILAALLPGAVWLVQLRFWASHDGTFHLYRIVELIPFARAGMLLPGWLPNLAVGYGVPLLSYYPPLGYLPAVVAAVAGLGPVDAFKLSLALALLLSGLGAYLLGRDLFASRLAGALVAIAYLTAPVRFYDTYLRASLSGAWVYPFLPLLLWSLAHAVAGRRGHLLLAGVWLALLVLAHQVIALFFLPVATAFALLAVLRQPLPARRGGLARAATALGLGLVLSTWFWLPGLFEGSWVATGNVAAPAYRPQEFLAPPSEVVDLALLYEHTQPYVKFGLVQVLAALGGVAAWPWLAGRRWLLVFSVVLAVVVGLLQTPALAWVWSWPFAALIQRPLRLLALGALGTALATGGLASWRGVRWVLAPLAALALILTTALTLSPYPLAPQDESLVPGAVLRFEADTGAIGTSMSAEYLPRWARGQFRAPNDGGVRPSGTANDPPLQVRLLTADPLDLTLQVSSAQGGPLRFHQFYFPAWQASIDGQPAPVGPSSTAAVLTVVIPPGEHLVRLSFQPTLLRQLTLALSALALLGALLAVLGWRHGGLTGLLLAGLAAGGPLVLRAADLPSWHSLPPAAVDDGVALAGGRWRAVPGGVEVDLFWLAQHEAPPDRLLGLRLVDEQRVVVAEKWAPPLLGASPLSALARNELVRDPRRILLPPEFRGGLLRLQLAGASGWQDLGPPLLAGSGQPGPAPPQQPVGTNFANVIELVGYDLVATGGQGTRLAAPAGVRTLLPGDTLELRLVWRLLADVETSYTTFVHLIGPDGRRYDQRDRQPDDGFRSLVTFQRGLLVEDRFRLGLPPTAPPGAYRLDIGWYRTADEERLSLAGSNASVAVVGGMKVPGPPAPADQPVLATLGPVALVRAKLGSELELVWQPHATLGRDYTVFVHVLDATGRLVAQADGPPLNGGYPTSLWSVGEQIVERRPLPPVPAGGSVLIGLYDLATGERLRAADGRDSVMLLPS